jgi:uncharacterized membrane protein
MSQAARSVNVFGIYLVVLGVVLLTAPNLLLSLFHLPLTTEVWLRVVGMLVVFLGMYYRVAAAAELRPFFLTTVILRASVPVFFVAFVLAGWAEWPLLLFGSVDAAGAAWTWSALHSPDINRHE